MGVDMTFSYAPVPGLTRDLAQPARWAGGERPRLGGRGGGFSEATL